MDFGKWYTANWTFSATQFRQENVKVKDGRLYLRVNRGESYWDPSASVNSVDLAQNDTELQSTSELQLTLSMPEFQVTGNSSDTSLSTAVVAEPGDFVQTPKSPYRLNPRSPHRLHPRSPHRLHLRTPYKLDRRPVDIMDTGCRWLLNGAAPQT